MKYTLAQRAVITNMVKSILQDVDGSGIIIDHEFIILLSKALTKVLEAIDDPLTGPGSSKNLM